jgi:PhnB protein
MSEMPKDPPIAPYLTVADANAAIEFYKKAFGATETFRMPAPDGRVLHCSLALNGGVVMLSDDFEKGAGETHAPGAAPITLHLNVADVDAAFAQAVKAGATVTMPLADMFWGDRYGRLRDPFGHNWSLSTHQRDVGPAEMKAAVEQHFGKTPE